MTKEAFKELFKICFLAARFANLYMREKESVFDEMERVAERAWDHLNANQDDYKKVPSAETEKHKYPAACGVCLSPCDIIEGRFKPTCDCEEKAAEKRSNRCQSEK